MGRGRKGIITQSHKKLKTGRGLNTQREKNIGARNKQVYERTKISVPEQALEFMKNMNQQQLVDFLLPNGESDWYIKTSAANASGN